MICSAGMETMRHRIEAALLLWSLVIVPLLLGAAHKALGGDVGLEAVARVSDVEVTITRDLVLYARWSSPLEQQCLPTPPEVAITPDRSRMGRPADRLDALPLPAGADPQLGYRGQLHGEGYYWVSVDGGEALHRLAIDAPLMTERERALQQPLELPERPPEIFRSLWEPCYAPPVAPPDCPRDAPCNPAWYLGKYKHQPIPAAPDADLLPSQHERSRAVPFALVPSAPPEPYRAPLTERYSHVAVTLELIEDALRLSRDPAAGGLVRGKAWSRLHSALGGKRWRPILDGRLELRRLRNDCAREARSRTGAPSAPYAMGPIRDDVRITVHIAPCRELARRIPLIREVVVR